MLHGHHAGSQGEQHPLKPFCHTADSHLSLEHLDQRALVHLIASLDFHMLATGFSKSKSELVIRSSTDILVMGAGEGGGG